MKHVLVFSSLSWDSFNPFFGIYYFEICQFGESWLGYLCIYLFFALGLAGVGTRSFIRFFYYLHFFQCKYLQCPNWTRFSRIEVFLFLPPAPIAVMTITTMTTTITTAIAIRTTSQRLPWTQSPYEAQEL